MPAHDGLWANKYERHRPVVQTRRNATQNSRSRTSPDVTVLESSKKHPAKIMKDTSDHQWEGGATRRRWSKKFTSKSHPFNGLRSASVSLQGWPGRIESR